MIDKIFTDLKGNMEKVVDSLQKDLSRVRTGRASLSLLDGIKVDYYGSKTPLNQVASLSVPESKLITIQPWDTKVMGEIEKAIRQSDLGFNPINDGKIIRISIPSLTQERRKELAKLAKKMGEDAKVSARSARKYSNDSLKELKKNKDISEDIFFNHHKEIQEITDAYIKKCEEIFRAKEKDILEF